MEIKLAKADFNNCYQQFNFNLILIFKFNL